ncbi:MAG: hypothetical protein K0S38_54 [Candidatus Paceibacter sp.]|nr:hypothetical protein [Candidatus Paceibacter sp.]
MTFGSIQMWERLTSQQQCEALSAENKHFAWRAQGSIPGKEIGWHEAVEHYFCNIKPNFCIFEVHTNDSTIPAQLLETQAA